MSHWDAEQTMGDSNGVCYFNYLKRICKISIFFSLTLFQPSIVTTNTNAIPTVPSTTEYESSILRQLTSKFRIFRGAGVVKSTLVKSIPFLIVGGLICGAAFILMAIFLTRNGGTISNTTTLGIVQSGRKAYTQIVFIND